MDDVSSPDVARRRPTRFVLGDMVRSLGLVFLIIFVLLIIGPARTLIFPHGSEWKGLDYSGDLRGFEQRSGHPALAPTGLPSSWRANSADVVPAELGRVQMDIGFATPSDHFVSLAESTGPGARLLRREVGRAYATPEGSERIGAHTWQTGNGFEDERYLYASIDGIAVVIRGDGSDAELRRLAASLR